MPRLLAQQRMSLNGRFTNIYLVHVKWKSLQNNDSIETTKC